MVKRQNNADTKYEDDDEGYLPTKKVRYSETEPLNDAEKKHTLDSDEEIDDEKYTLNDEDIDGQEETTVTHEGETKITPFNMQEEMEEGCFDQDGYYQFNKDGDQIKDAWLDDVDWMKVKHKEVDTKEETDKKGAGSGDDEPELLPEVSDTEILNVYKLILPMMKEGESIAKSLKRLGGNPKRLTTAQRWKLKKQGKLPSDGQLDMKDFIQLTEYANNIVEFGNMDVYQETYEMINLRINRSEAPKAPVLDMFGDIDTSASTSQVAADSSDKKDKFDEIMWQYVVELKPNGEDEAKDILGPYTTTQMQKWQSTNYFKKAVYVRKISEQSGPWYKSNRMDFDIYL